MQAAYGQCHNNSFKQRRLILIYLITSNIILGRFPSLQLLSRPEATGLIEKFQPVCQVIKGGNLADHHRMFDLDSEHANWFLHYRIFFQLKHRCEILVWRSLSRKLFLICGNQGDSTTRKAPTLGLQDVLNLVPSFNKHERSANSSMNDGNLEAYRLQPRAPIWKIECLFASMIQHGLLNGYISHKQHRFAIQGAKKVGPLAAGFPNVWRTMKAKSEIEVPGWKKEPQNLAVPFKPGAVGPGTVVSLSGARPVGTALG